IIDRKALNSVVYTNVKYVIAVVGIVYGSVNFNAGAESNQTAKFEWQYYNSKSEIERSIQNANGKPTMIDFTADWCAACKELDKYTYTNSRVIELSMKFNNIKVDLTKENKEISDKYKILGLPVVAFIDKYGNEISNLRVTGFVEPEEFSNVMEKALSN
ncbi:MAG: thioredoxin fold domain-containing protein, partial [Ignavibacteria bacterium]